MPPLPLDPALSAVAPQECLWYVASAGKATPDPNSENQIEQLLAEPEVQQFAEAIQEQLLRGLRKKAGGARHGERVVATEVPKLIRAVLTRPFALFVEDVQVEDRSVSAKGALVLSAGEQQATIQTALDNLQALALENKGPITTETLAGIDWNRLAVPEGKPSLRWGWKDGYFIVAVGEGTAQDVVDRMAGAAPDWLNELREAHPVEREMTLAHINVAGILERIHPIALQKDPEAWQKLETLGITCIQAVHCRTGLDGEGLQHTAHLVTDGQRRGLLALLPHKPLGKRDLQLIPNDALMALAARVDAKEVFEEILRIAGQMDRRARDEVEEGLWQAETRLGVNVKEDILGSLDDVWVAFLPGGDAFTSWTSAAAAVRVKDAERLRGAISKLTDLAGKELPPDRRRGVTIRQTEFEGKTIYYVNVVGEPFPFAPAWCVSDEWLIVGLMPQTVRSALQRQPEESLADLPIIQKVLDQPDGSSVISYQDTPKLVKSFYPFVQMFARGMSGELQKEGIDVDISLLPSVDTIVRHLRPNVGTFKHTGKGFECTNR